MRRAGGKAFGMENSKEQVFFLENFNRMVLGFGGTGDMWEWSSAAHTSDPRGVAWCGQLELLEVMPLLPFCSKPASKAECEVSKNDTKLCKQPLFA